jgi:hypothetical protein
MADWRWRMCPRCRGVERASAYAVTEYRPSSWEYGNVNRCCPSCGYEAPTHRFEVVRERHTEAYQTARAGGAE